MGANRSYNIAIGGVPENMRSHTDTGRRIDGHKVVLQTADMTQSKNIMNSNSDSPVYLIGHTKNDGTIEIHSINIFEGHYLKTEINLKYDGNGNILAFNGKEANTHSYSWERGADGIMHRKFPHTHESIPQGCKTLLRDIVSFNKQGVKRKCN